MAAVIDRTVPTRNGSGLTEERKSFGGFLRAVARGNPDAIERQGGVHTSVQKSAANDELSGAAGGWLVPMDYTARFIKPLAERSIIYRRAHVQPMASLEMTCPMLDATTALAAGTVPFFGGILSTWGAQMGLLSANEFEPQFRSMTLHAWDNLYYAIASNQLLMDMGPGADDRLLQNFGQAGAWYAEYAFFNGTGAANSLPLGMLNAPCALLQNRAGSNHIAQADVKAMVAMLLPMGWANAIWCCSVTALADIIGITGYIPNINRRDDADECVGYLANRPLYVTDKLPAIGTKGDLILTDPSLYAIGDRMQVVIDVSEHAPYSTNTSAFQRNQAMFRVWLRQDGKPILDNFVTLPDAAGSQVSSIVVLN